MVLIFWIAHILENNVSSCGQCLTRRPGVGDDGIYRDSSSEEGECG